MPKHSLPKVSAFFFLFPCYNHFISDFMFLKEHVTILHKKLREKLKADNIYAYLVFQHIC